MSKVVTFLKASAIILFFIACSMDSDYTSFSVVVTFIVVAICLLGTGYVLEHFYVLVRIFRSVADVIYQIATIIWNAPAEYRKRNKVDSIHIRQDR